MYRSGHLFFHSEIWNFTVVPKRPFVFLQQNTKFYSCTQSAIRFLQRNAKFRIVPKWPFVFSITKHKILKFVPKRPFVLQNEIEPFSKKCDIYCNKHYWCMNYAAPFKGLQQIPQNLTWELSKTKKCKKGWFHRC